MNGWYYGNGPGGGGWWFMAFMMIAFWVVVVIVVIAALRHWRGPGHQHVGPYPPVPTPPVPTPPPSENPLEVLRLRLAKGEIDADEFERRRALLTEG